MHCAVAADSNNQFVCERKLCCEFASMANPFR